MQSFGIRLHKLLLSHGSAVPALSTDAEIPGPELDGIIAGGEPTPEAVRRLGPALGIHTADMFVIAGLPVPVDLASAYPTRPWDVAAIIRHAIGISPTRRQRLNDVILAQPTTARTEPVAAATLGMLGAGRVVVTPQYVTAFAHLLGFTPDDMVAITGIGPAIKDARAHPASTEIAELAWNARNLSSNQISDVLEPAQKHRG